MKATITLVFLAAIFIAIVFNFIKKGRLFAVEREKEFKSLVKGDEIQVNMPGFSSKAIYRATLNDNLHFTADIYNYDGTIHARHKVLTKMQFISKYEKK